MSNNPPYPPYGGGENNPYGNSGGGDNNPYGGQPPYGGTPYPGGYGGQPAEPQTDGVSIAALVTGLICCAPVSLVLGFVGLSRTKNNQRKGRWAAITGVALGALGILTWIGVGVFVAFVANSVVTPDNAEVGQCVDIETEDGEISMTKKDCTEEHDGEIVAAEEVDSDNRELIETTQVAYCFEALSEEDAATIEERDDLELEAVLEDPSNVEVGDHIVCYVEATSGKLDEKVLD